MQDDFLKLLREIWTDLHQPDIVWQIVVIALCLLAAWAIARRIVIRRLAAAADRPALKLGSEGVRRVAFPLSALLLIFAARALLKPWLHVNLLNLAVPLLISLGIVRVTVYLLRQAFPLGGWVAASERIVVGSVWTGLALYLSGLSPLLIEAMQSVSIVVGKDSIDLWTILRGLVIVVATVLIAFWFAGLVERRLAAASGLDSSVRVVLSRVAKALLALVAVLFSLSLVGIDITALSVFSGALGVGLGLGLQKIASNYVSGFIILLDRSIRLGNVIALDNQVSGIVTLITTRYTVIRTLSGTEVIVPNEHLVSNIVQNQSYTDTRVRIATQVQVAYSSDLPQAMALLERIASAHPRVLAEPPARAAVLGFADSGINLEIGMWIADPEEGTGNVRSDVNLEIWREFRARGVEIPFPQREVRVLGSDQAASSGKVTSS